MSTANVSLPGALKARRAERQLAALVREGLESGKAVAINRSYWVGKRRKLARRAR